MNNHPNDIEYILPHGDNLRDMLSQTFIFAHDLRHLLRCRGVFMASNEKSALVPALTATLLSPLEFQYLCDCWSEKEDNLKITTDIIPWQSPVPLMEAIPDVLEVSSCVKTEFRNYSVIGSPIFTAADARPENDEQADVIVLEFQIQRNDLAKSWVNIDKKYFGWLEMAKIDNTHVRLTTTYTSDETLEVASGVKQALLTHFRSANYVPEGAPVESVNFLSFDNEERVRFLLSLTKDLDKGWLTFRDLVDMEIRPDDTQPLPEKMNWMADKIREMRMKGQSLHQVFILVEPSCHPHVQLFEIEARFNFAASGVTGQCIINMGFPAWRESSSAPMVMHVSGVTLDPECRHVAKSRVKREILSRAESMKIAAYASFPRA